MSRRRLRSWACRTAVMPTTGCWFGWRGRVRGRRFACGQTTTRLSMQESPDNLAGKKVCVSKEDGLCHACGHDGHAAMALGAMRVLHALRQQLAGSVLFLFESGEERGGLTKDAVLAALREEKADTCFAIHLDAAMPTGSCNVEPGARLMGAASIGATLRGRGGHGSRPDEAVNPINAVAQVVCALQGVIPNCVVPGERAVLSVGVIEGGTVRNIIPETASFAGSVRFLSKETGQLVLERVSALVKGIAAARAVRSRASRQRWICP